MQPEHQYQVSLQFENDRKGTLRSEVLNSSIEVATPPDFPKGMPGIWSPEHLLVAAVSSCLMTTFLAIAENSKLEFFTFDVNSMGKLETVDGKLMMSEITLLPVITIRSEHDRERAERILNKSEAACLISNSVKSKIIFKPEVLILNEVNK